MITALTALFIVVLLGVPTFMLVHKVLDNKKYQDLPEEDIPANNEYVSFQYKGVDLFMTVEQKNHFDAQNSRFKDEHANDIKKKLKKGIIKKVTYNRMIAYETNNKKMQESSKIYKDYNANK